MLAKPRGRGGKYSWLALNGVMSPLCPLLRHATKQQGAKLGCRGAARGYLESSFLRGSQRLPFWRVQELVRKDVVKELSVLAHSDPAERTGGAHRLRPQNRCHTNLISSHNVQAAGPTREERTSHLTHVSYPLWDSCRCSSLWGCPSFLCGKRYLLPLPYIPSVFRFLLQSQPS